ncbi:putative TMhelix containing protein [Vibrio phage 466E53-1]|nr:putative TMhelix containing protein [Vibrio phage 466E53-1]
MNEQLQGAVAQILERAISGIDSSIDFMQAELPDVIEQLLLWYAVSNVIYTLLGLFILYASYWFIKKPKPTEDNWLWYWIEREGRHGLTAECVFGIFTLFPGICGFILSTNIMKSIQIWVAPKIWLMEYAANLVK